MARKEEALFELYAMLVSALSGFKLRGKTQYLWFLTGTELTGFGTSRRGILRDLQKGRFAFMHGPHGWSSVRLGGARPGEILRPIIPVVSDHMAKAKLGKFRGH